VQVAIIPVQDDSPEVISYVSALADRLRAAGLRADVDDKPGVLAAIGHVFAEEGVSISSFIQKDASVQDRTAELVVTTHPSSDSSLQKARAGIAKLEPVHAVSSFLRVF
jgi:homoserine dehydrogenase